ncbi:uncharacterized protein [Branchiostoma lanceolatum]|uniref:uncharacterized protein n=1 Tax=Branchiostoma lanceolatum TaxID=7740 RepID=UPI003453081F
MIHAGVAERVIDSSAGRVLFMDAPPGAEGFPRWLLVYERSSWHFHAPAQSVSIPVNVRPCFRSVRREIPGVPTDRGSHLGEGGKKMLCSQAKEGASAVIRANPSSHHHRSGSI